MKMVDGIIFLRIFILICACFSNLEGRIHTLILKDDSRNEIDLTTFGFLQGGYLVVKLEHFQLEKEESGEDATPATTKNMLGFSLDKTNTQGISPMLESNSGLCIFDNVENHDGQKPDAGVSAVYFIMDFDETKGFKVIRLPEDDLANLTIAPFTEPTNPPTLAGSLQKRKKRQTDKNAPDAGVKPSQDDQDGKDNQVGKHSDEPPAEGKDSERVKAKATKDKQSHVKAKGHEDKVSKTKPATKPPAEKTSTNGEKGVVTTEKTTKAEEKKPAVPAKSPASMSPLITVIPFPSQTSNPSNLKNVFFNISISRPVEAGLYNLFFHNCLSNSRKMNLTVYLEENNNGNFLSAGEMPLPTMYFLLSLIFFAFGIFWLFVLKTSKEDVFKTHYVMTVLIFVKALSMLLHAVNFHFIAMRGKRDEAFAILWYITYLIKGILLFVTIVLIGAGWAFVKHVLSDREKKLFVIVIPLQILANVAQILLQETEEGNYSYSMWREIFILVDLLCCGAILFPIVWSIRHLQVAANTDGKAAVSLKKLKVFRHFYILVVCYIYFTRIIVYLLQITLPYEHEWLTQLFRELGTLVVFVITGYKFRPESKNPYLRLPQEQEEMEEVLTASGMTEGLTKVNVKTDGSSKQKESSHEYD